MRPARLLPLLFTLVLFLAAAPAVAGNYRPLKPSPKKTPPGAAGKKAPGVKKTTRPAGSGGTMVELTGEAARERIADLAPPRPIAEVPYPVVVDPKTGQKVIVITNDVLERRFGRSRPAPPPPGANIPMPEPVKKLIEEQRKEEAARKQAEEAARERQEKIRQLEQEIAHLERRILSIRNPFYRMPPRDQADRQEDAAAKSNAERLAAAESRLRKLREELAKLKAQGAR